MRAGVPVAAGLCVAAAILAAAVSRPPAAVPTLAPASPHPPSLALGSGTSPHRLVIWSDYECPACALLEREAGPALRRIAESGALRVEIRHFPLPAHRRARRAAVAAICAERQGEGWAMHESLLATAPRWRSGPPSTPWILRLADSLRIDGVALAACMADPRSAEPIEADLALGRAAGLSAVPAVLLDGRWVTVRTPASLVRRIRRAVGSGLRGRGAAPDPEACCVTCRAHARRVYGCLDSARGPSGSARAPHAPTRRRSSGPRLGVPPIRRRPVARPIAPQARAPARARNRAPLPG